MKNIVGASLHAYRSRVREARAHPGFLRDRDRIAFAQGWTGLTELELLYLLAAQVSSKESIVEIGSFCGRTTIALTLGAGCREHAVITIDPHTGDVATLRERKEPLPSSEPVLRYNLALTGIETAVDVWVKTSVDAAMEYADSRSVGLLVVDGWHTKEAVLADTRAWSTHLAPDAIVSYDDWRWPDVMAGIRAAEAEGRLPPRLGTVGGHLLFGSRRRIAPIFRRLCLLADETQSNGEYLRARLARLIPALASAPQDPAPIGWG